jgi:hypothetical protein
VLFVVIPLQWHVPHCSHNSANEGFSIEFNLYFL